MMIMVYTYIYIHLIEEQISLLYVFWTSNGTARKFKIGNKLFIIKERPGEALISNK